MCFTETVEVNKCNYFFRHIEVGKEIREHQLHSGFDEARNCHIVDDDKLLDHLEVR